MNERDPHFLTAAACSWVYCGSSSSSSGSSASSLADVLDLPLVEPEVALLRCRNPPFDVLWLLQPSFLGLLCGFERFASRSVNGTNGINNRIRTVWNEQGPSCDVKSFIWCAVIYTAVMFGATLWLWEVCKQICK